MRTTVSLDDDLVNKAGRLTDLKGAALLREALKALIQRESARRLALLGSSEPDIEAPSRRRTSSSKK